MKNLHSISIVAPLSLFSSLLLASGCLNQAPTDDVAASSSELIGGTDSPASQNSVVLVAGADGYCSGTLIAPNLVLTAHHCVTEIGESRFHIPGPCQPYEPTDIDVTTLHVRTGPKALSAKAPIAANVVKSFHDPNADVMCGNDLALILLDRSLNLPVSPLSTVAPRIGDVAYAVGYGFTSDGDTEPSARQQLHGITILDVAPIDEPDGGELGVSSPPPSGIDGLAGLANGDRDRRVNLRRRQRRTALRREGSHHRHDLAHHVPRGLRRHRRRRDGRRRLQRRSRARPADSASARRGGSGGEVSVGATAR